ncbi:hypothetical protein CYMTET_49200 [Cymbomonas tetramitiformis]|uniref:CP-type G domain-containing protein n=1 Tax=Cymbomonas tetramitiformis TaxID=36881 RepID=A0AAE0EUS5_9CHLO|nr:hypothetical protein CYMTET_49200 [Cymbomonas tetramitiformis]
MPKNKKNSNSSLGRALTKAGTQGRPSRHYDPNAAYLHTTEEHTSHGPDLQSVVQNNDLDEFLALADLSGKQFVAERSRAVVVQLGDQKINEAEQAARRLESEAIHQDSIRVPRRPEWSKDMTAEELDRRERESFLIWRRTLAVVENDVNVNVTPFEKNLEVWRQLWRVVERSDLVVQVVDARDPLLYRCEDLEQYIREVSKLKRTVVLLNKADMLPVELRERWADHFDRQGCEYLFWSAKQVIVEAKEEEEEEGEGEEPGKAVPAAPAAPAARPKCSRSHVLGREEMMITLEEMAAAAATADGSEDPRFNADDTERRRIVVGFVGYPNVGKSSTLNAIIGQTKTSVGATPGRTKHFQTYNISENLCLCDCPGLVFPRFTSSKADMVVAGVLPIDRLTDVVTPVGVVAARCNRAYLESVYSIKLPRPQIHEGDRPLTGHELLRALAASRGWTSNSGLPDETKSGRTILKDTVDGKVLCCHYPPGKEQVQSRYYCPNPLPVRASSSRSAPSQQIVSQIVSVEEGLDVLGLDALGMDEEAVRHTHGIKMSPGAAFTAKLVDKGKQVRPEHKFHKKAARTKGNRGEIRGTGGAGGGLVTGKRGGLRPQSEQPTEYAMLSEI